MTPLSNPNMVLMWDTNKDEKLGIKKDATLDTNEESKHGANLFANMVAKLNVNVDVEHGAK